jgi:hypothetical protein
MASTQIGQWSPTGQVIVHDLETDGGIVLKAAITSIPQVAAVFAIPFVGWIASGFAGYICNKISKILIDGLDRLVYATFVSIRIGKQVSDYVKAQDSGNQSSIDQAADDLIHAGKT